MGGWVDGARIMGKRVDGCVWWGWGDEEGDGGERVFVYLPLSSCMSFSRRPPCADRLVGLVVKASASRAEGPGFESRLRRDFFGVESYQ